MVTPNDTGIRARPPDIPYIEAGVGLRAELTAAMTEVPAGSAHMDLRWFATMLAGGLLVGMLLLLEIGRRSGLRRLAQDVEGARVGSGMVEGAVFGLVGLLIAFTFSGLGA